MAEKRVIWLVPTHLPRLPVFKTMLASLVEFGEGIESAVVFTYHAEAAAFEAAGCVADNIIVLEDFFTVKEIQSFVDRRSIINVKKLFALKMLFGQSNVSRVAVSDDEVEIVRKVSREQIANYETKYDFHRVRNEYLARVIAAPLSLLSDEHDRTALQRYFVAEGYYGWFSDLPIYEREYMASFFKRFSLEDQDGFSALTFESFDWLMYAYSKFLDEGAASFRKHPWPAVRHAASWFEMGYHSRLGRKLLKNYYRGRGSLWVPNQKLLQANSQAVAIFNTDRDYRKLQKRYAVPLSVYTSARTLVGRVLGRP